MLEEGRKKEGRKAEWREGGKKEEEGRFGWLSLSSQVPPLSVAVAWVSCARQWLVRVGLAGRVMFA